MSLKKKEDGCANSAQSILLRCYLFGEKHLFLYYSLIVVYRTCVTKLLIALRTFMCICFYILRFFNNYNEIFTKNLI